MVSFFGLEEIFSWENNFVIFLVKFLFFKKNEFYVKYCRKIGEDYEGEKGEKGEARNGSSNNSSSNLYEYGV